MRERILSELNKIEREEGIKILYAVESGSRGWGFESKDSDYDVRFIYIRPTNWYLSIDDKRDVLEYPINDLLDISGWDLQKALKLYRKSNPVLFEWLRSPIIYMEKYNTINKIRDLSNKYFSPKSSIYHYLHMAEGNYREYLKKDHIKIKKYFYVLRPILGCMWIEQNNTQPPMEFEELMKSQKLDDGLHEDIMKLLARKKGGDELNIEPRIEAINRFLEDKIEYFNSYVISLDNKESNDTVELDQLFIESLEEVWN